MPSPCHLAAAWPWSIGALVSSLAALLVAGLVHVSSLSRSDGDERTRAVAAALWTRSIARFTAGADAIAAFVLLGLVVLLTAADDASGRFCAWGFAIGALLALVAARVGLASAAAASGRVAEAARSPGDGARRAALGGGAVAALASAGLALLGVCGLWLVAPGIGALFGAAFGASGVAWILRALHEDEAACLSAELFESCVAALVAAMAVAASAVLPLALVGAALVAAIVGRRAPLVFAAAAAGLVALAGSDSAGAWASQAAGSPWDRFKELGGPLAAGLVGAFAVGSAARHAASGSAPLASSALPAILVGAVVLVAHSVGGLHGVALAGLTLAAARVVSRGGELVAPITASAASLAQAARPGDPDDAALAELARSSRSSAAFGRGVSSACAAVTALVLVRVGFGGSPAPALDLRDPDLFVGLLVGAAIPSVAASTFLLQPTARSGAVATAASTTAALRAMIGPAFLAVATPLVVGGLNPGALGGLLFGAITGAFFLAARNESAGPALNVLIKLMGIVAIVATRR